uniref:Uncharacterized protein n=1 Tax=Nelumbo nucifera TaxID=4432 RepID=A0A822Y779_NELNU|nr:TPA_asm: hypothetical protein HUJ06_028353 [Nelumbo nucifera]
MVLKGQRRCIAIGSKTFELDTSRSLGDGVLVIIERGRGAWSRIVLKEDEVSWIVGALEELLENHNRLFEPLR